MSIDYSNVKNGLPKVDKNGFFPMSFFAYDWSPDFGFSGFRVFGFRGFGYRVFKIYVMK
jgi:hypothetical protein